MASDTVAESPVRSIPAPETIRVRLSTIFEEAKLLRALLRVSERAHDSRANRREVAHAG